MRCKRNKRRGEKSVEIKKVKNTLEKKRGRVNSEKTKKL